MRKFLSSFVYDPIRTNQLHSVLRFSVNFFIGILFVHSFMSQDTVGILEYSLFLAYTGSFVFTFAYSSAILSKIDTSNKDLTKAQLNHIFWQLLFVSIFSGVFLFIGLQLLPFFGINFLPAELHIPVCILSSLIILVIPAELFYILTEKAKQYFYYTTSIHVALLISVIIALLLESSLITIISIYIALQLFKLLVVLYNLKPIFTLNFTIQKEWFLFTLPLIFHFILGSTMDYLDGHIVASYFDENSFLFYRYGARELPLSMILLNAISASFIPLLSKNINDLSSLKARVNRVMHFVFPISIVLLFISPFAFKFFYGEDFILSAQVFNFYLLVISSRVLMPHTILYAKKDNMALVWLSGVEFVINLGLSLYLISIMGITGVALATVIAFIINRLLSIIYVARTYDIQLKRYLSIIPYSIYMIALIVCFFAVQYFIS